MAESGQAGLLFRSVLILFIALFSSLQVMALLRRGAMVVRVGAAECPWAEVGVEVVALEEVGEEECYPPEECLLAEGWLNGVCLHGEWLIVASKLLLTLSTTTASTVDILVIFFFNFVLIFFNSVVIFTHHYRVFE